MARLVITKPDRAFPEDYGTGLFVEDALGLRPPYFTQGPDPNYVYILPKESPLPKNEEELSDKVKD
ncbi:hypothetical protein HOC80_02170 [archaeon]|jgi:hypothetical protein|nr:hypothetical protein [archaeon]MBT4416887.1 hypothetical protein [archaeon]